MQHVEYGVSRYCLALVGKYIQDCNMSKTASLTRIIWQKKNNDPNYILEN